MPVLRWDLMFPEMGTNSSNMGSCVNCGSSQCSCIQSAISGPSSIVGVSNQTINTTYTLTSISNITVNFYERNTLVNNNTFGQYYNNTGAVSNPYPHLKPILPATLPRDIPRNIIHVPSYDWSNDLGRYYLQGTHKFKTKSSKRKRRITNEQRRAANIRERRRMSMLNEAFDNLRLTLPTFHDERKLSRIETLRIAAFYIQYLTDLLGGLVDRVGSEVIFPSLPPPPLLRCLDEQEDEDNPSQLYTSENFNLELPLADGFEHTDIFC